MSITLYNQIYFVIYNHKDNLKINQSSTSYEIRNAIRWVMRDNTEIFGFAHQYHYDETSSTIHFHLKEQKQFSRVLMM